MGQIVTYSIRDESLHVEAMTKLFREFIQENLDIWTVGLDMEGDIEIDEINFNQQNIAIFLGSEEKGISKEVKNKLDVISNIQMLNNTESLNVSIAGAIAMHQIFIKK